MTVFYDYTTTFSNDTMVVTCCSLWQTPTTATCGRGLSCGAVCQALDSPSVPAETATTVRRLMRA